MKSPVLFSGLVVCLALAGCGSSGGTTGTGGTTGSGGTASSGGTTGTGGAQTGSGGTTSTGGTTATGGTTQSGGTSGGAGRGGSAGSIAPTGRGGAAGSGLGGRGTGGTAGHAGATGSGGATGTGGSTSDGGNTVDCTAMFPTGGQVHTGTNVNGTADGLNYGIWTNGSGGSITTFTNAHAFSASWDNSMDFLAHLGLDFNTNKAYTAYGTIEAQYVEIKSGSAGGFSSIGMYGWMHSPCIEWYINEDSFNGLGARGNVTATIDGGTYYLTTTTTTGTGGANACESGHTGGWTQIISTRKGARTCGTITVSDHFAAWEKQGWTLGTLSSVHINVEVGGGTGSIQFPIANVTTTSK
ncbi:MAG TPA: glycoside hydrolase family 11 protein [Polyangia bacterium]|nr:glycoside hydrolase family 11 protein [Polyangia bacterium]